MKRTVEIFIYLIALMTMVFYLAETRADEKSGGEKYEGVRKCNP